MVRDKILKMIKRGLYTARAFRENHYVGPPIKLDQESYFLRQQAQRRDFVEELLQYFNQRNLSFCSVGCGLGGEEFLLQRKTSKLVLIEPDHHSCDFLQKKFSGNVQIFCGAYQNYDDPYKFDVIYASSPSNWMYSIPWDGIPSSLLNFVLQRLKQNGIFIVRLYGGIHPAEVLTSDFYVKLLITQLKQNGLNMIYYVLHHEGSQALMVVARYQSDLSFSKIPIFEKGILKVKDSVIVKRKEIRMFRKIWLIFNLAIYAPLKILKGIGRVFYEVGRDIVINLSL